MDIFYFLHIFSILFELAAAALGILLATNKKKAYGWCIALTFLIYIFYDIIAFLSSTGLAFIYVPQGLLYLMFFIASTSILWTIWQVYSEK